MNKIKLSVNQQVRVMFCRNVRSLWSQLLSFLYPIKGGNEAYWHLYSDTLLFYSSYSHEIRALHVGF